MGSNRKRNEENRPSVWERVVAGAGLVLVLAVAGYLAYQSFTAGTAPPDVVVDVQQTEINGKDWVVTFKANNKGSETAAAVVIHGELRENDMVVETAQVTLDYVPANSTREGGLFFTKNPANYVLHVRALGYMKP